VNAAAEAFAQKHQATLQAAMEAARSRAWHSAYPETPSGRIYGETAKAEAEAAFQALLHKPFADGAAQIGAEVSPWGPALGITYPAAEVATLIARAEAAAPAWAATEPAQRAGICLEILHRLNRDSFLMAQAVMHTTGQAFAMAFQAGGPHAQDRGLEAVAYAMEELSRIPGAVRWTKQAGKETLVLDKTYRAVPRGIGLVIGCATFPTWNGYPGIFASLATGNAVIVKPHPAAILPLALTVRTARAVLAEAGLPEDVIQLAPDTTEAPVAADLARHEAVGIVDFTGGPAFGAWLRAHVGGRKALHTEEAGINPVVLHSTDDFAGLCRNLAFSLCLYSGQMCTAPQNIFIPAGGIATNEGPKDFDAVCTALAGAVDGLLADSARAVGVLGAIQNPAGRARQRQRGDAGLPGRAQRHAAAGRRGRRCLRGLGRGTLRADRLPHPLPRCRCRAGFRGGVGPRTGCDHRAGARHRRRLPGAGRGRLRPRRRGAQREPDRRHLREPVRGLQRLPRLRRQSRGHLLPDGRGLRRQPLPHRHGAPPRGRVASPQQQPGG
jgi:phenylacetic acid degradation protein paaN